MVESILTINGNTTSITDAENYTITTYYDNGTVKVEFIGSFPTFPDGIIWQMYKIENNNQIIFSNFTEDSSLAWNISISEDGKNLTITKDSKSSNDNFISEIVRYIKIE